MEINCTLTEISGYVRYFSAAKRVVKDIFRVLLMIKFKLHTNDNYCLTYTKLSFRISIVYKTKLIKLGIWSCISEAIKFYCLINWR
jgi:hypothetical protein